MFLYILNVVVDISRYLLRINIVARSLVTPPPYPTINNNDLVKNESLGTHSMNIDDHPMNVED